MEFGQNPAQIFEKPHPNYDDRSENKIVFDYYNIELMAKYTANVCKQKESDPYPALRVFQTSERNVIMKINGNNEFIREQLTMGKYEIKRVTQPGLIARYFSIYSPTKAMFIADPESVITASADHLVICRNQENSFFIYSLSTMGILYAINFHKVFYDHNFIKNRQLLALFALETERIYYLQVILMEYSRYGVLVIFYKAQVSLKDQKYFKMFIEK